MSEELKACPFCGSSVVWHCKDADIQHTKDKYCILSGEVIPLELWQGRPLEAALQSELDKQIENNDKLAKLASYGILYKSLKQAVKDVGKQMKTQLAFTEQFGHLNKRESYDDGRVDSMWLAVDILRLHGLIDQKGE